MKALVRTANSLRICGGYPIPQPLAGEVLLKVGAFCLDRLELQGDFAGPDQGRVLGIGAAGQIVAAGDDVPAWRLGDMVIIDPGLGQRQGTRGLMGIDRDGGAAEYLVASAGDATPVSAGLASAVLPLLASHYSLGERVLTWGRLFPRETVLVIGADQGAGPAAVELAAARRADVTAVAEAWAHDGLLGLGAARVAASLPELGRSTFDVIVDFRSSFGWSDCLALLSRQGVYVSRNGDVARSSGPVGSALDEPDIFTMETLEHLARLAEKGALAPRPGKVISFAHLELDLQGIISDQQMGPTVVIMDP